MKKHFKEYWLCYFLVIVFVLLADYKRVVCCEESNQLCTKCKDYIEYYFGD